MLCVFASTMTLLKQHTTVKQTVCVLFYKVTAAIAEGKRPAPFRTRKLSPPAPMVLHPNQCGRVGHRRTQLENAPQPPGCGAFSIPHTMCPDSAAGPALTEVMDVGETVDRCR